MTRLSPDRMRMTLLGVACGDALGRPVDGLSSAEIARSYGRVTEMYADGVHGAAAGTVTACTRDALAVARELFTETETNAETASAETAATIDLSDDIVIGSDASDGTTLLPRAVPCAGFERETPIETAIGDVSPAARGAAVAVVDLLRHAPDAGGGPNAGATAVDAALDRASDRDAPRAVRTALAVALDPVDRLDLDPVSVLEVATHDAFTAGDPEEAVATAVSRGGPTTTVGAVTGALAGARFGTLPDRWLDRLEPTVRSVASLADD